MFYYFSLALTHCSVFTYESLSHSNMPPTYTVRYTINTSKIKIQNNYSHLIIFSRTALVDFIK